MDTTFTGTRKLLVVWQPVPGHDAAPASFVEPRMLTGLPVPPWQRSFRLSDVCTVKVAGKPGDEPREHAFTLARQPVYYIGRQLMITDDLTAELGEWRAAFEESLSQGGSCILPRWADGLPAFTVEAGQTFRMVTLDTVDHIRSITRPLTPAGTFAT